MRSKIWCIGIVGSILWASVGVGAAPQDGPDRIIRDIPYKGEGAETAYEQERHGGSVPRSRYEARPGCGPQSADLFADDPERLARALGHACYHHGSLHSCPTRA